MHLVRGTDIIMTRGDTLLLTITMYRDGKLYFPHKDDIIRFAMKRKNADDEILINKIIPNDTLILEICPEDTNSLRAGRTYVYDIELKNNLGMVDTFISGTLHLGREVL